MSRVCGLGPRRGQFYIDDLAVDAIQYDLPKQIGFYFPTAVKAQPPSFIGAGDIKRYKPILSAAAAAEVASAPAPVAAAPPAPAALDSEEPAAALLDRLGLRQYEAALAIENVTTVGDALLLTREDLKELGLKIGDRNKLLAWQRG